MKFKYRLGLLMVLTCCVVIYVSFHLYWSWRLTEGALTHSSYMDRLEFSINKLEQQTYRYRNSYSRGEIESWQQLHHQFSRLLTTAPALSAQQQTLQNSIKKHNEGLLVLFKALIKIDQLEGRAELKAHLMDKLIAKMQTIREDSRSLSVLSREDIVGSLSNRVLVVVPVLLIVFCFIAWSILALAGWLHRSLSKLKRGLDSLGNGKLGELIAIGDDDDFNYIYRHFNDMSQKLCETTISRDSLQQVVDERTAVLERLANTDPLTQVATRRLLFERGKIEFSRAQRHGKTLSVLMIDCDYFKKINDEHGHVVGDKALIYLCQLFQKEVRDIDLLCRFGGEEFVIILPDTSTGDAEQVGKRIQLSMVESPFVSNHHQIALTISIGLASSNREQKSFEQLLDNADRALLRAKDNGRNRLEMAN